MIFNKDVEFVIFLWFVSVFVWCDDFFCVYNYKLDLGSEDGFERWKDIWVYVLLRKILYWFIIVS